MPGTTAGGPLARQLQTQGLAAAAEYQRARAAVDDILVRISSHPGSVGPSSTSTAVPAAATGAAAAGATMLQSADAADAQGAVTAAAGAAGLLYDNSGCTAEAKQQRQQQQVSCGCVAEAFILAPSSRNHVAQC
jgi:hypothetical protein